MRVNGIGRCGMVWCVGLLATASLGGMVGAAADWPAYRGPTGDGVCGETIETDWPDEGPKVLWRTPLLHGFSSMTVAEGKVFTLTTRRIEGEDREICLALDARTGLEEWAVPLAVAQYASGAFGAANGSDGPRSTPVVDGNRVFALDSQLGLFCLAAETGEVLWTTDVKNQYGGRPPTWQSAAAPVIESGSLALNSGADGRSLMVFETESGQLSSAIRSEAMTYATPWCGEILGVRQLIYLTAGGLRAVGLDSPELLWKYDLGNTEFYCAMPVVADNTVFVTAGYGRGATAVRLAKNGSELEPTKLWEKRIGLQSHWMSPVHRDGHVYGMFGYGHYDGAPLKCVEVATGQIQWSQDGFGHGGIILAGERLVVLSSTGDLVVVAADPTGYHELARTRPFSDDRGRCWNSPAVSDGVLFVRGTREIVALDVAPPPPEPLRLARPEPRSAGGWWLRIDRADGQAVDPARADRLEVLATTDLGSPLEEWTRLTNPLTWEAGSLLSYDENSEAVSRKFYHLKE